MKRIEINLMPETCDDTAHAERVLARLRVELSPLLPEGHELDTGLYVRGGGRRMDPVWLPDTDPDDPEYDRISDLAYETMDRIRTEEGSDVEKWVMDALVESEIREALDMTLDYDDGEVVS